LPLASSQLVVLVQLVVMTAPCMQHVRFKALLMQLLQTTLQAQVEQSVRCVCVFVYVSGQ